jgi:hypothetical protein
MLPCKLDIQRDWKCQLSEEVNEEMGWIIRLLVPLE